MKYRLLLCSLPLIVASEMAVADEFGGRVDINYSEANPDFSPFPNGEGISVYGRLSYDSAFLFARHSNPEFRPSGDVSSADEVESWNELGLGYALDVHDNWTIEAGASWQEVEQGDNDESGHEIYIGAGFQPWDSLSFDLSVGQIDVQIDDWNLDFETRYSFYENVYFVAKLRDYADWDFTYYEAGLGIGF